MKNNGLTVMKIIIGVMLFIILIGIFYQLYQYNFVSIRSESAVMGEMEESLKANGVFFRNEKPIGSSGYEYLDVVRNEGERIAANGVIARIYASESAARERKEIREIEERIAVYEEVLANSGSYKSAAASIEQEIYTEINSITMATNAGESIEAFSRTDDLIISIMKKKIAAGDLVSYDAVLKELRSKLSTLKASSSASVNTIKSDGSGYFSLSTDGLEGQFNGSYLEGLTTENFAEAQALCENASDSTQNIGKVVYDNSWSVAMMVPSSSISRLEVKDTVYIRIPSFGPDRIKCVITDIRKNGDQAVLVLSSSIISGNILTLRQEEIHLIIKSYTGIQIRHSALRKVDGEDGVYVKVGMLLRYKNVNILYNDGENAIIEYDAANNSGLKIYDQVVYKGSNLYDGKAVSDG